ncbi:MAG: UDP-glucose/GDP-mannose dehydrogenase family protein [Bdellovibrionales bacterium]|nr:UDP-glucose/GDP-mannose dehydrogenase family protein [Bdellovibrionales bacterium]
MEISVIGSGYVGLVAGACFADSGNNVICVDKDPKKIEALLRGEIPIYEPGLKEIVERNRKNGRLRFTTSLEEGVRNSTVIFIAVGTPQDEDGSADLSHVLAVAKGIGQSMDGEKIVVDKSTVPVGTAALVRSTIEAETTHPVHVVSNPEFLKEGAAIDDFMKPDRVVVGVPSEKAADVMRSLYEPFLRNNNPLLVMDVPSAEMTKYAANAMLATRISFMNEMASLCERVGANIDDVRIGIGTDTRIGMSFLFPGVGYGGSCFPKDVQALVRTGQQHGVNLQVATAVELVNAGQKRSLVKKMVEFYGSAEELKGKCFGVWGLAFKPKTDDVREAPALVICEQLLNFGATLQVSDPEAMHTFREKFGEREGIRYIENNLEAAQGVDALVIVTEWNDFRRPEFADLKAVMKSPVIFDGRNLYKLKTMAEHGFTYFSVGRPSVTSE